MNAILFSVSGIFQYTCIYIQHNWPSLIDVEGGIIKAISPRGLNHYRNNISHEISVCLDLNDVKNIGFMGHLRYLVSIACLLMICLNVCLAFPMWYGHPIIIGDYGRARNWWENGNVDHGVFSGWGLTGPRPVNIDSMADSDDTI
ncbi:uncharacterized protein LOC132720894 [Ruditapes philippinarum]|uniref:uncharacterized protein LOC132720894 n=1 Tax=Ruditapes philippinarum TaxID=129788 RepID=UPI00295A7BB6|nr:uncharacterized protein LOC132720894 [Ruditapes philippinarum]